MPTISGMNTTCDAASINAVCSDPDFRITTSLRWSFPGAQVGDSFYCAELEFHQKRLLASARTFHLKPIVELLSGSSGQVVLLDTIKKHLSAVTDPSYICKLTLSISPSGSISVAATPLSGPLYDFALPSIGQGPVENPKAKVYIAQQPTAISVFTLHKTNHRPMYTSARVAAGIEHEVPTTAEVLLYNYQNEITEASLSTVYFLRNGQWITPTSSCGGNLGSTRSLALTKPGCVEGIILREDIVEHETIILSNGARGFWPACVSISPSESTSWR